MKKFFMDAKTVLCNEYIKGVKRKSFILVSLLMPCLALIFSIYGRNIIPEETKALKIAVKNYNLSNNLQNIEKVFLFYNVSGSFATIAEKVQAKEYDAILDFKQTEEGYIDCVLYYSIKPSDTQVNLLNKELEYAHMSKILLKRDIDINQLIDDSKVNIKFSQENIVSTDHEKLSTYKMMLTFLVLFIVYIGIFQFSSSVMKSINSEKNSKIIEVILSSVSTNSFMTGKILGASFLSLTQFAMWITGSLLVMTINKNILSETELQTDTMYYVYLFLAESDWILLLISLILFFVMGFFLYASIFAVIGSLSNRYTDSQQFVLPVTLPIIFTFIYSFQKVGESDLLLSFLSYFPLTSPIAMLARVPYNANLHEIIISLAILLFSIVAVIYYASMIFNRSILNYNTKFSLKHLFLK